MNWVKIIGNVLVAFSTSAIAINIAGINQEVIVAFYVAFMTGILALGKEFIVESGEFPEEKIKPKIIVANRPITMRSMLLL